MSLTVYFSHPIRGKCGDNAPQEYADNNCELSIKIANQVRSLFPNLGMYVPAEHEEFVLAAYKTGNLTVPQILDVDCGIMLKKDLVIVLDIDGDISGGRAVEIDCAIDNQLPFFFLGATKNKDSGEVEVSSKTFKRLKSFIDNLESKNES